MLRNIIINFQKLKIANIISRNEHNFPSTILSEKLEIPKDKIEQLFDKNANLTKTDYNQWLELNQTLTNQGFRKRSILKMVPSYPEILNKSEQYIIESFDNWRACQFGESSFQYLITSNPHLVDVKKSNLDTYLKNLIKIFPSQKQIFQIFEMNPFILFEKWEVNKEKLDYLLNYLCVDKTEIIKSSALSRTLEEIKCRHVFLERLGLYKKRNFYKLAKEKTNLNKNPQLKNIIDTDDSIFVKNVCGVSLEEFRAFQLLYKQEYDKEIEDEDYDELDDIDSYENSYKK